MNDPRINDVMILSHPNAGTLSARINDARRDGWVTSGNLQVSSTGYGDMNLQTIYAIMMVYHGKD